MKALQQWLSVLFLLQILQSLPCFSFRCPPPSLSSTIIALIRCCVFGLSGKFVLLLITVVTGHSPVSCWDLIIKNKGEKKRRNKWKGGLIHQELNSSGAGTASGGSKRDFSWFSTHRVLLWLSDCGILCSRASVLAKPRYALRTHNAIKLCSMWQSPSPGTQRLFAFQLISNVSD